MHQKLTLWFTDLTDEDGIIIIVYAVRQSNPVDRKEINTPLDLLKERYARGEFDKTQFEERKKTLKK